MFTSQIIVWLFDLMYKSELFIGKSREKKNEREKFMSVCHHLDTHIKIFSRINSIYRLMFVYVVYISLSLASGLMLLVWVANNIGLRYIINRYSFFLREMRARRTDPGGKDKNCIKIWMNCIMRKLSPMLFSMLIFLDVLLWHI
jgi:hypothetical protein